MALLLYGKMLLLTALPPETVLEEHVYCVPGNYDVALVAVKLNGQDFTIPEAILNGYHMTRITHNNGTDACHLKTCLFPERYVRILTSKF